MSAITEADTNPLDEPLTITFAPVKGPSGEVTSITITEPTAAQMEMWDGLDGTKAQIKAVSVCSSQPVSLIEKLPARAFRKAVTRVEAFLV